MERNGYAALVTTTGTRSEDSESSENGSCLGHDEDGDIQSDCSSEGECLPEDRPERSYSKIESLCSPSQHKIESGKFFMARVRGGSNPKLANPGPEV